jgi:sialic acid synthase SpsE
MMRIGSIDTDAKVFIVAEIGNNHEGDRSLAEELIMRAAEAGADAVKFQTIVPERLVEPGQTERLDQLRRLCLPPQAFPELKKAAERAGVLFLSTPFDLQGVDLLAPLVPAWKIASADNDFLPLLDAVAQTAKPILLSTGLSSRAQIARTRDHLRGAWAARGHKGELALLHCVSSYPTPPEQANLTAIKDLSGLVHTVGYSDHTLGIEAAVLAVALGARIVEKHFTLDKAHSNFRDHQLSADPREMAELVRRIRQAERMLGDGRKQIMPCEQPVAAQARRSAVAARDLPQGTLLGQDQVEWLRPGGGIPPTRADALIGRRLLRAVRRGERIRENLLA